MCIICIWSIYFCQKQTLEYSHILSQGNVIIQYIFDQKCDCIHMLYMIIYTKVAGVQLAERSMLSEGRK